MNEGTVNVRDQERLRQIRAQAQKEIEDEDFEEAVKQMKIKLRQGKWWHTYFPWQIIVRRRKANG